MKCIEIEADFDREALERDREAVLDSKGTFSDFSETSRDASVIFSEFWAFYWTISFRNSLFGIWIEIWWQIEIVCTQNCTKRVRKDWDCEKSPKSGA